MARDLSAWDEVQLDPLTQPPEDFDGLSVEEAVEAIKDWFLTNFEDPVHITPYESREGGYQYIWGGPYDAHDVIENVFAGIASDEIIQAAIEEIEEDGLTDWAPNSRRIQRPEDEPPGVESSSPEKLHAEMLERIAELEKTLAEVQPPPVGIGHNNPPEPIDDAAPLTIEETQSVHNAIAVLKTQPIIPGSEPKEAVEAANRLLEFGKKVTGYIAAKADVFVDAAAKSAGSEFGKWTVKLAAWTMVAKLLADVGNTALQWLHSVPWPF
jgi:hypothetical protein